MPQRLKTFFVSSAHRNEVFILGAGTAGSGTTTGGGGSAGGGEYRVTSFSAAHEERTTRAAETAMSFTKKDGDNRFIIFLSSIRIDRQPPDWSPKAFRSFNQL